MILAGNGTTMKSGMTGNHNSRRFRSRVLKPFRVINASKFPSRHLTTRERLGSRGGSLLCNILIEDSPTVWLGRVTPTYDLSDGARRTFSGINKLVTKAMNIYATSYQSPSAIPDPACITDLEMDQSSPKARARRTFISNLTRGPVYGCSSPTSRRQAKHLQQTP